MGTRLFIERDSKSVCLDWLGWDIGGIGMPPVLNRTSQAPFQNGASFLGTVIDPRVISLVINPSVCSESDIQKIYNLLSPAYLGVGDFVFRLAPETEGPYELRGVKYVSETRVDNFAAMHKVRTYGYQFVAFDPLWYGAEESVLFGPTVVASELEFPAEFPIEFDTDSVLAEDEVVVVGGNWTTWPTVIFTGPMESPAVRNDDLGEMFRLLYTLDVGEIVTATFNVFGYTIENNSGDDLSAYVSEDSHLSRFYLEPSIYFGDTTLQVRANGCVPGVSTVVVSWEPCYVGV